MFYQFREACRGIADACRALGTPVTGGNVSFYNESPTGAVLPTPTIGMVGVLAGHRAPRAGAIPGRRGRRSICLGTLAARWAGRSISRSMTGAVFGAPPRGGSGGRARADRLPGGRAPKRGSCARRTTSREGGLAVALVECAALAPELFGCDVDSRRGATARRHPPPCSSARTTHGPWSARERPMWRRCSPARSATGCRRAWWARSAARRGPCGSRPAEVASSCRRRGCARSTRTGFHAGSTGPAARGLRGSD